MATKLDQVIREDWEKSCEGNNEFPAFEELVEFLDITIHTLRAAYGENTLKQITPASSNQPAKHKKISVHVATDSSAVKTQARQGYPSCSGRHRLVSCPNFENLNIDACSNLFKQKY